MLAELDQSYRPPPGPTAEESTGWFEVPEPPPMGKLCRPPKNEFDHWDYLRHANEPQFAPEGGTHETRFHKGFRRRNQTLIGQDKSRLERTMMREERAKRTEDMRRRRLEALDKTNGFNVMTGEFDAARDNSGRMQRKHFSNSGLTDWVKREGDVLLRTSASRFYRPEPVTNARRQHMLRTEGLPANTKYSSVLGIGRAEMRSYGVADNFEYSLYDPSRRVLSTRTMSAGAGITSGGLGGRDDVGSGGGARPATSGFKRDPELVPSRGGDRGGGLDGGGVGGGGGGGSRSALARAGNSRLGAASGSRRGPGSRGSRRTPLSRTERDVAADIAAVRELS